MKQVKEFISLLPFITLTVIIVGLLKLILFYYFFNIPIQKFLDPSEALLIFTDDLFILLILVAVPHGFHFMATNVKAQVKEAKYEQMSNEDKAASLQSDLVSLGRTTRKLKRVLNIFSIAMVLIGCALLFIPNTSKSSKATGIGFLVYATVLYFDMRWTMMLRAHDMLEKMSNILFFFPVIVSLLWIVFYRSIADAENVNNGKYIGTRITTADSTYISDSLHFYVGRTNNFTFIYNKADSSTAVLPNSEIKKFVLKSK